MPASLQNADDLYLWQCLNPRDKGIESFMGSPPESEAQFSNVLNLDVKEKKHALQITFKVPAKLWAENVKDPSEGSGYC